jgi:hypothetical protein
MTANPPLSSASPNKSLKAHASPPPRFMPKALYTLVVYDAGFVEHGGRPT